MARFQLYELPIYTNSTPSFTKFDPRFIPWQTRVMCDMPDYNYADGVHEILLSGAVGSAKSILAAHLLVRHCMKWKGARNGIGRRSMPDLKATLFKKVYDHISPDLVEGKDFRAINNSGFIKFRNGSEIISRSWADRRSFKTRSLELSCEVIEEAAENDEKDRESIEEFVMRAGRLNHVKENWVMMLTNPDSPSHWLHKRFMEGNNKLRHVYYSVTVDNPFLPPGYVKKLLADLDPKMAMRMVWGKWLDVKGETIYHQYDREKHEVEIEYVVDQSHPIHFTWDFNIGEGKPLSVAFFQIIDGLFHWFDEVIIGGARTESNLEEAAARGLFDYNCWYYCHGDASGTHRDTRNKLSDYGIIDKFMINYISKRGTRLIYKNEVLASNPGVRDRHNVVNSYLCNALGQVRMLFYPKVKVLREGMKLTKLRKGAEYVEDDTKFYQHVTTALGYAVCWYHGNVTRKRSGMRQL